MPATPNIIDQLGTSWKLTVQEFAVYSYQHPTFGYLEYTGRTAWLCDNVNTVWLTQQGSLPDNVLPPSICIGPKYDGECGYYDVSGYPDPADKCACADPECPFLGFIALTCNGVTQTCSGMTTHPGRAGADNPSGPSYELCCTLHGKEICFVTYCSDGQWKTDIYCDGVLQNTQDVSSGRCPFTLGGFTLTLTCDLNCDVCVGPDCPPPSTCDPSNCDDFPDTMTINFSGSTCLTGSTTITRTAPGSTSWVSDADVGTWSISAECTGGNFTVSPIDNSGQCAINPFNSTVEECNPVSVAFGTQTITDIAGCTCVGDVVTASLSS